MDELKKLERAKMYVDKLANGVDPITDTDIQNDSILNNIRLARCFFYISDVLRQVIENGGTNNIQKKTSKNKFYITQEQRKSIEVFAYECYMKDISVNINKATEYNNCYKFQAKWISTYLVSKGYIDEYVDEFNKKMRKATPEGEKIGIRSEIRNNIYGIKYSAVLFSSKAQAFIIDNIYDIIEVQDNDKKEFEGSPWTEEQETVLIDFFNKKTSIYDIAITLKRTETAIRARLVKLGMIENSSDI